MATRCAPIPDHVGALSVHPAGGHLTRVCVCALLFSTLCLLLPPSGLHAQEEEYLEIEVRPEQSLRAIAREYLDDPDLWQEILRVNGLDSPTGVKPGMILKVPRTQVSLATQALSRSQETIQEASRMGAKVFAADLLQNAVDLHDQALTRRKVSDWKGCQMLATDSQRKAGVALDRTRQARDSAGQAVLSSRAGSVESREPGELSWREIVKGSVLIEKEKVRTLSSSQAEILFVDESRLRLSANSQAVIQRMRVDQLSNRQEASVSLVEGDLYALLGGSGKTKKFDVEAGGVSTDTRSSDFWMSRRGTTTKIANYDDSNLVVRSGSERVTLTKNQGALLRSGESAVKRDLLPAPLLREPEDDHTVYHGEAELRWDSLAGAVRYRLEVSSDQSFRNLVISRAKSRTTTGGTVAGEGGSFAMWRVVDEPILSWLVPGEEVEDGVYYWRVAGIDDLGFPGAKSQVRRLTVRKDAGAPYLAIVEPAEGAILRSSPAVVTGVALSTGSLTLAGTEPVNLAPDGSFSIEVPLQEGINTLAFEVTDDSGRTSQRSRSVVYMPDRPAIIEYDDALLTLEPGTFVVGGTWLPLKGRTTAGARVTVHSASGSFRAGCIAAAEQNDITGAQVVVDEEAAVYSATRGSATPGEFQVNLLVHGDREEFVLQVTAPSGHVTEDRFTVVRDTSGPVITVPQPPDIVSGSQTIRLSARVEDARQVTLNGNPVSLRDGILDETVILHPGPNRLLIQATDAVGNTSRWQRTVVLDRQPPRLLGWRVSPQTAGGGEMIEVSVQAADDSNLKRTAAFAVKVGVFEHRGALLLDPRTGAYSGSITLPRKVSGRVALWYVVLEDQNGNGRTYRPR